MTTRPVAAWPSSIWSRWADGGSRTSPALATTTQRPPDSGDGRQVAVVLAAESPELDGVCCGSDQVARGVIDGLRECGCQDPDDVAVVGFDNWDVHRQPPSAGP